MSGHVGDVWDTPEFSNRVGLKAVDGGLCTMAYALYGVVIALLACVVLVLVRAAVHRPKENMAGRELSQSCEAGVADSVNTERAVKSLSDAIQVRTVSFADRSHMDTVEFDRFHALLDSSFPLVRDRLTKKVLGYNLVYLWKGAGGGQKPIALMSHMDVVPADDEGWEHPPFSGAVADGFVWGRGALDIKFGLITILEAIEELLEVGFVPSRDVYVVSTCDEEVGNNGGITEVMGFLKRSGVDLEWVLDEGGVVGEGMMAGFDRLLALVGVAEKGYLDVELSVEMTGGHSSSPGRATSVGLLSRAIAKVEARQMPTRMGSPVREFFNQVSRYMGFGKRLVFANMPLFQPLITAVLLGTPETASMIRTTTAPTMISGGVKPNVLAPRASAVINCRLLPGDTAHDVVDHINRVVADDRVKVRILSQSPASRVSSVGTEGFTLISSCIAAHYPGAVVAPYLVMGATDSKGLEPIAEGVYRFVPVQITKKDLARMHGVNERVSIENIEKAVRFFRSVVVRA
ncbi:MAG: M20/M25/M40 family metallo-hydrolase [Clostridia bacterium]|nr:M20/M25/M40 family metallo-hydrolase [Clostridia bacterium]